MLWAVVGSCVVCLKCRPEKCRVCLKYINTVPCGAHVSHNSYQGVERICFLCSISMQISDRKPSASYSPTTTPIPEKQLFNPHWRQGVAPTEALTQPAQTLPAQTLPAQTLPALTLPALTSESALAVNPKKWSFPLLGKWSYVCVLIIVCVIAVLYWMNAPTTANKSSENTPPLIDVPKFFAWMTSWIQWGVEALCALVYHAFWPEAAPQQKDMCALVLRSVASQTSLSG